MIARIFLVLILTVFATTTATQAASPDSSTMSETQTANRFEKKITYLAQLDYLLHLPADYKVDKSKEWPLIVFLHGSGEKGTNVDLVKIHGPPKIVADQPDFSFILVSPQCPLGQYGWSDRDVLALIHEIASNY